MLTSSEKKQLHKAIGDTYDADDLERMLNYDVGKQLWTISSENNPFNTVIFDVIDNARKRGWTQKLLDALHRDSPHVQLFGTLAGNYRERTVDSVRGSKSPVERFRDWPAWIQAITSVITLLIVILGLFGVTGGNPFGSDDIPTSTNTPLPTETPIDSVSITPTPTPVLGATRIDEKTRMVQVYIPEGDFWMGSTPEEIEEADKRCDELNIQEECQVQDEKPFKNEYVDAFWIDKTEVSNEQFAKYVHEKQIESQEKGIDEYKTAAEREGGAVHSKERGPEYVEGRSWLEPFEGQTWESLLAHPVVHISWSEASNFCEWRGGRLPTVLEWEKVARWNEETQESFVYPWGDQFDGSNLNYCDQNCDRNGADNDVNDGFAKIAPVDSYPDGASPYGVLNMAGNVWEWTSNLSLGENDKETQHMMRGGSWRNYDVESRSAYWVYNSTYYRSEITGIRCVHDAD